MARVRVNVPVEPPKPVETTNTSKQITLPHFNIKKVLYVGGAIAIAILLFVLIQDRNNLKNELSKGSTQTQNDVQKYQSEVASLVEVPAGITPKAQPLTDTALEQLATKDIAFKNAQAGDVVLVYEKTDNTRFIVIYRPSSKKVILATAATTPTAPIKTQP